MYIVATGSPAMQQHPPANQPASCLPACLLPGFWLSTFFWFWFGSVSLAQLDSVLGAPALCCVNGIALCVSGMGFMWRLCGSVYVRFGPLLAYAGLSWPSLAACTAGHPAETQFRKELPDRGTGTKPACDRLRGSWGRSWCPVRLLPFWPCKTASKPRMWRYVADMGIVLRCVINGIELSQEVVQT